MNILYIPRRVKKNKFGLIYNLAAALDIRGIASTGWHLPTREDFFTLRNCIGGYNEGYELSEPNLLYWDDINGYTNSTGFSGRGSGSREPWGTFRGLKHTLFLHDQEPPGGAGGNTGPIYLQGGQLIITTAGKSLEDGFAIRLIKNDDTLEQYIGNDGFVYKTVKIGNQVWLAENLIERKYADGSTIPEDTIWNWPNTGVCCAYNNDWNNV
jgi:uncharacterized protein (TIGR02145 family)